MQDEDFVQKHATIQLAVLIGGTYSYIFITKNISGAYYTISTARIIWSNN